MQKTASKIIIPSESCDIPKTTLGTFFEKTIQARGLKLGIYVPLMSFYKLGAKLISEIFEKIYFSIFMAENGPKDVPKSVFVDIFFGA